MVSASDAALLQARALALLRRNVHQGHDPYLGRLYAYVCPSRRRYHWQWFWDSCFHAIALSRLDLDLAQRELLNLVSVQESDGFIGHVTHWGRRPILPIWGYLQSRLGLRPHHTALVQPPVLAYAAWRVFQAGEDTAFLKEIIPHLNLYYRWLAEHRDPDGDGLVSIITPYESGLDHSPAYDAMLHIRRVRPSRVITELRLRWLDAWHLVLSPNYNLDRILAWDRFVVEDVLFNCIYAEGLWRLGELDRAAGQHEQAGRWEDLAQRVEAAILSKCHDPATGLYFNLEGRAERRQRVLTVTALFPLILKTLPRARAEEIVRHLTDANEFWLPYPVPSVARSDPSFDPARTRFLWRGPTWLNTNWFLMRGLRLHGYAELAQTIAQGSAELVLREGFREYFNPLTGQGLGARGFGWSTLVVDML
ncbi:MAG: hypothetical protein HYY01_14540 [Chloroflexi bacterium]|nr:hypothetical protein [Chloroflexota bacterium]